MRKASLGLLTNIVAAEEDELEAVGYSPDPLVEWSGVQFPGIDTTRIAMLHCLLTGDEFDQAILHYEPAFVAEDTGILVLRLDDEAMERLTVLEEEALEEVAEELAATEAFEEVNLSPEEVLGFVMEMADLARLAESQGQVLFVWMCPLTA